MGIFLVFTTGCKKDDNIDNNSVVRDADGNVYHTVTIGSQVWMVENLATTKYSDSTAIISITDATAWCTSSTGAYCWYNNDSLTNKSVYGALYNWYAVNNAHKLAPKGWHVPSDAEWATLISFLNDESVAGGKLKEKGTLHWFPPNTDAVNSYGFTALPGGSRYWTNGGFYLNGKYGWYWSSTENTSTATEAWHKYFIYNAGNITRKSGNKIDGFTVRCIKDQPL
jgi:uncharacterized protein (TIGR02145 family)